MKPQELAQAPAGWRVARNPAPHPLAAITFYEGPPQQNASLVYDSWKKVSPAKAVAIWRFAPSADGIWISCQYASTDIVLEQQLSPKTSECTVTYNPQVTVAGLPEIQTVSCKGGTR